MSRDRDRRLESETPASPFDPPTAAAVEDLLASGFSLAELRDEYRHLRNRYDAGQRTPRSVSPAAVAAYAVGRLPATMAATGAALGQLANAMGGWEPSSLLDLGSGVGSSAWAAVSVFPRLSRLTLVEDAPGMVAAAKAAAALSTHRAVRDASWSSGDTVWRTEPADLVIAAYVLGELDARDDAVEAWWRATTGAILIVEPGTPAGYERILRARAQLVDAGARLVAPCPHRAPCPLRDVDGERWCHFGVRIGRSARHRVIKDGTLGSEDEKFSYVAAARFDLDVGRPRVLREPSKHGGHVRFELCAESGIRSETVSRRDPDYQLVRKLRWGDALERPSGDPIAAFVLPYLAAHDFRRLTLSAVRTGAASPLRRAVIRPVEIQGRRQLQVVTQDEHRATTRNVPSPSSPLIADLLHQPFRHVTLAMADAVIEGRVTKRGKLVTSRSAVDGIPLDLRHDRQKQQPIPPDAPFLAVLGISVDGRVKPTRRAKYRQINDFIRLLDQAAVLERRRSVRVLDVGCGNAYLTFATMHHLVRNRGIDCSVVGVDRNSELVHRNARRAEALGFDGLHFEVGDIEGYRPETAPDVVLALHACDTAADHALAAMVRWGSDAGFVAPCCHHHVQDQMRPVDAGDRLLVRDGILRERLGDVLTDATRAAILRLVGYAVDVVQFVDPEHTPRNALIRASRGALPPPDLRSAYQALVGRWGIHPLLGDLLADELGAAGAP